MLAHFVCNFVPKLLHISFFPTTGFLVTLKHWVRCWQTFNSAGRTFKQTAAKQKETTCHKQKITSNNIFLNVCAVKKMMIVPNGSKHGREGEESCHGHGDPARDRLRREKERQPCHDDKQPAWQVRLEQVVADLSSQQHRHDHARINPWKLSIYMSLQLKSIIEHTVPEAISSS